jgi:hypothetical protein
VLPWAKAYRNDVCEAAKNELNIGRLARHRQQ